MDYTYEQLNEYPLRILVPSDSVGAIIGKQGSTVKQIKQTTHAKVDVNKSASSISPERVIVIRGQPENCIQACREILQIMSVDARNKNKPTELVLKVLAHNNFIGRIIGKGGNIINTIKQETETNITVSSVTEFNSNDIERIISIKGELDQQIRALEMIYTKLCVAFEHDQARGWDCVSTVAAASSSSVSPYYQHQQQQLMQYFAQQAAVGPPLVSTQYPATQTNSSNPTSNKYMEPQSSSNAMYQPSYYPPMFQTSNPFYMPYPTPTGMIPAFHPASYSNGNFASQQQQQQQYQSQLTQNGPVANETVRLYVPNAVIGAIIGTKGLFIKSIIKNSNASVKITPINPDEDPTKIVDREIIISGTPEAQWKSQYYIHDKIRQEGYTGDDDVRLRAEIYVPTALIGRLVGKGGQNVRQLQQSTGATIKLPEDSQQTSASEISVKIIGTFQASQFAQRRIQSIIQMSRDSSNTSHDDSNNHNPSSTEQSTSSVRDSLVETSATVNGSMMSDDAVVAFSTLPNTDHSVTVVIDEQKAHDE